MTAAKDTPPNVVELQQRQPVAGGTDRLGDLLKLVRGISLKRINGLVGTLFENVDDALFEVIYSYDGNITRYKRVDEGNPESPFEFQFGNFKQLGVNATLQARF